MSYAGISDIEYMKAAFFFIIFIQIMNAVGVSNDS